MNTPAHLILGAALFARPDRRWTSLAALSGSFLPDASLYFMVFWNKWVRGMSEGQIFGVEYFSPYWQGVFAVDNSVIVWGTGLAVSALVRLPLGIIFFAAGLVHLVFDFALHHDDGRAHFWPLSDWVFESPVSYWDSAAFGNVVGPMELALSLVLLVLLWRRFAGRFARAGLVLLGMAEVLPALLFPIWFS